MRGGKQGRRPRLLDGDGHVGRAMLQRLEVADRLAELAARPQVLAGHFQQAFHRADSLGAVGRDAAVDRTFEFFKTVMQRADAAHPPRRRRH